MTQYSNRSFSLVIADFSEFCLELLSMMILFKKKQINKQTELRKKESRNGIKIDAERRILAPRFGSSANLIFIKFIWHLAIKTISTITFCGPWYLHDIWDMISNNPLTKDSFKCKKHSPEVFCKNVFLKISQNLQESTCARVTFLNKVAGWDPGTGAFLWILRNV